MHILCLIDNLDSGGAQRQLATLGVQLHRRGHLVRFLTYAPQDFYAGLLQAEGIPLRCCPEPNAARRAARIRQELRRGAQDAVLAFLEVPAFLAELAALPSRRWGLVVGERSTDEAGILGRRGRLLRLFQGAADAIVANSQATRRLLQSRYPALAPKLHTIYNTLDLDQFAPDPAYRPRDGGQTRLLVAASYQRLKNLDGLIAALALLTPAERAALRIDWHGAIEIVPGNRAGYDDAAAEIARRGFGDCLRLHPRSPAIAGEMARADVVALFSRYEGLPNAICEGMACGKPVLMSDVSDARVLAEPGVNGFLCDPADPASIAAALRATLGAPDLPALGRKSRAKAEELFNPRRIVEAYEAVLTVAAAARAR